MCKEYKEVFLVFGRDEKKKEFMFEVFWDIFCSLFFFKNKLLWFGFMNFM